MLVFEKQVNDNPSYYYRSTAELEKEFRSDMTQVWVEVLKRITENRANGTWNRLLFECWCDQGFLEIYPQQRGQSPDDKKPRINVALDVLNEIKQKLEESEVEEERRSLTAVCYSKVRGMLRNTYKKEPALTELKNVLKDNDFMCWTMKGDDIETLMKFDIYF